MKPDLEQQREAAEEYANTLHGEWELEYESDEWTACYGDFLAGLLYLIPALEAAEKRIEELEEYEKRLETKNEHYEMLLLRHGVK